MARLIDDQGLIAIGVDRSVWLDARGEDVPGPGSVPFSGPGVMCRSADGSKYARAEAAAPMVEAGNVWLPDPQPHGRARPERAWVDDFLHQPRGRGCPVLPSSSVGEESLSPNHPDTSTSALDGPWGPVRRRLGENSQRYLRVRRARWNSRIVDGLSTIAERITRAGRMNSAHTPARIRSDAQRFGARCAGGDTTTKNVLT